MTPLAQRIAKELTLKPSKRTPDVRNHADEFRHMLHDTHFFDASKAMPLVTDLMHQTEGFTKSEISAFFGPYVFLPAPKTFLEVVIGASAGERHGIYMQETSDDRITLTGIMALGEHLVAYPIGIMDQQAAVGWHHEGIRKLLHLGLMESRHQAEQVFVGLMATAQTMLYLINQPQLVSRKVHAVHKGAARDLHHTFGRGFPLHGWIEITIDVAKPWQIDDGQPHTDRLTGSRALHFVRKHIRIRDGKIHYVAAHWRGDASLGIKQSRYLVTA